MFKKQCVRNYSGNLNSDSGKFKKVFRLGQKMQRYLLTIPEPRIAVLQDCDHSPGLGTFIGGTHVAIHRALDCIGVVTNGAVRDLETFRKTGIDCLARQVSVSHAYAHVIEFGVPVEIGGLKINPTDLLYGDRDGVLSIPLDLVLNCINLCQSDG